MRSAVACAVLLAGLAHADSLALWHAYRGGEEQALLEATKHFTEKTGIEVNLLSVPYDAFSSKLTTAIPHQAGPDIFIFAHERLRQFKRLDVVAESSIRDDVYLRPAVDALELDGKHYGYPLSLKCLALFSNDALVSQPPQNTDELIQLSKTLIKKPGVFGLAYESGDFYFHAPILAGFGGALFNDTGRAQFDTAPMAQSLAFIKGLQDQQLMPTEASGALVKSLFNANQAGLVISGPWFAGEIDPSIHYRISALPLVSSTGKPMAPFLGVEAAFVSSQSKHQQQAQQLAEYLSTGEGTISRVTLGRQIPAELAAWNTEAVKGDPVISAFREAAMKAVPTPNTLEMARVWEPMKLALRAVLQGGVTPEDGGRLAERRYKALNREAPSTVNPIPYILVLGLICAAVIWFRLKRAPSEFASRTETMRALAYVAPAAVGVLVLIILPLLFGIALSLFHHDASHYEFVGFGNFIDILFSRGYAITEPLSFYFTLAVTILWTVLNVSLHLGIGLALALVLKNPMLRFKGVYRVLFIIPWAVPNYITALLWKGMFHRQFGAMNAILGAFGVEPISWFNHWVTSFGANVITNTWLGFPFMMVVSLGALQSIPQDLYEAAEVDGASKWQQFRSITLPLLRPALLPSLILGSVWTFNMFNIIYLVSGGEPGGATDILVSEAYRWAFQRNEQYGFAAAYSVLIFVILFAWSRVTNRLSERMA